MSLSEQIEPDAAIKFLSEAATYFARRPTGGEDAAFWANVANAETCQRIAALLAAERPATGWVLVPRMPTEKMMAAGLYQASHDAEYADVYSSWVDMVDAARAEGVAALQQAGDLISRENLEAELRETIGLYVREAVTRMFSEENATYRCARQIAGMLQPGYYLHRKLFSSPLPQQTALVEQGVEKIIAQHEPAACGASAPSEAPLSAEEVDLPNYWRAVVGDTYKPAVLRNVKHMHPATVKEVFDRHAGTDVADVIAGLIFKNQIANNRSEFFAEEYAKATAAPPPPTDGEVK